MSAHSTPASVAGTIWHGPRANSKSQRKSLIGLRLPSKKEILKISFADSTRLRIIDPILWQVQRTASPPRPKDCCLWATGLRSAAGAIADPKQNVIALRWDGET